MSNNQWSFVDSVGTFRIDQPDAINELYFPLCNHSGFMSSVTPTLHGDIKQDQHHFLLAPISVNDLHNSKAARNFWVHSDKIGLWSVTGNSAAAHLTRFHNSPPKRSVQAGLLWHQMTYTDELAGLESICLNFVPANDDQVEIMMITVKNIGTDTHTLTPTSAIPIYGRGAENQRDHRHVTSLVNRIIHHKQGIELKPVIVFDETGHRMNTTSYYVLGATENGALPLGSIGSQEDFIGLSGDLEWPESLVKNHPLPSQTDIEGHECMGALRFDTCHLEPNETATYILMIGIHQQSNDLSQIYEKYNTLEKVNKALHINQKYWIEQSQKVSYNTGSPVFSHWMKWVSIQPLLRKIYGCSFLPYHDYGKGGRGWRDLWQDLLSLIVLEPKSAKESLINNFGGIRLDGSNATIIGSKPGEFIADRNNIPRVWMDHGAWPFLTTMLYINQSGDSSLLFAKQTYFKDRLIRRAQDIDAHFNSSMQPIITKKDGSIYEGTILEHLLVQHLTAFFNVGEHNILLLEGADWNDTLDMARQRGESVAFSAFYASNLLQLAELLKQLHSDGIQKVTLYKELLVLCESQLSAEYDQVAYKRQVLNHYFDLVSNSPELSVEEVDLKWLIQDLEAKGNWLFNHIRGTEWVELSPTEGFFNGYYNNDGGAVDGIFDDTIRMNLTGQVFTTMFGLATDTQVTQLIDAVKKHLKDPSIQGFKLNTPLGPNQLNFGRGFSFAYGEKENGAVFSHMVVMYMNALYRRNFIDAGYEVFNSLYQLSIDTEKSKIYPGIPEYFALTGKGMYHYLTGSASWLFLTVLHEMFGIKGELGQLVLEPKLVPEQWNQEGCAEIYTQFAGKKIKVLYKNSGFKSMAELNEMTILLPQYPLIIPKINGLKGVFSQHLLSQFDTESITEIEVTLK